LPARECNGVLASNGSVSPDGKSSVGYETSTPQMLQDFTAPVDSWQQQQWSVDGAGASATTTEPAAMPMLSASGSAATEKAIKSARTRRKAFILRLTSGEYPAVALEVK
jgi:hypothetical protein